jgi:hypothetical protein
VSRPGARRSRREEEQESLDQVGADEAAGDVRLAREGGREEECAREGKTRGSTGVIASGSRSSTRCLASGTESRTMTSEATVWGTPWNSEATTARFVKRMKKKARTHASTAFGRCHERTELAGQP